MSGRETARFVAWSFGQDSRMGYLTGAAFLTDIAGGLLGFSVTYQGLCSEVRSANQESVLGTGVAVNYRDTLSANLGIPVGSILRPPCVLPVGPHINWNLPARWLSQCC